MKTKNKKLLKTFDNEDTTVYQVYFYPTGRCFYFNEKPNKTQLKNIAEKYFHGRVEKLGIEEIKVFNLK
jgi:hypothetical protein